MVSWDNRIFDLIFFSHVAPRQRQLNAWRVGESTDLILFSLRFSTSVVSRNKEIQPQSTEYTSRQIDWQRIYFVCIRVGLESGRDADNPVSFTSRQLVMSCTKNISRRVQISIRLTLTDESDKL